MLFLFSETGRKRLDEIVKPGLLCVFDFDGTLSPITPQPDQAILPLNVKQRLIALSNYARIAIITGRSLADIKTRLMFYPYYLVGNHGLEGMPGWERHRENYESLCRVWKTAIVNALQDRALFDPAIQIEDKRYSLSIHYRLATDRYKAKKHLSELLNTLHPNPHIVAGKYVFNLLPTDAACKGSALQQLMDMSGAANAIYVGDDITDEDIFQLRRHDLLTVRVEHTSNSAAQFYLHSSEEILRLLDEVLDRLRIGYQSAQAFHHLPNHHNH